MKAKRTDAQQYKMIMRTDSQALQAAKQIEKESGREARIAYVVCFSLMMRLMGE